MIILIGTVMIAGHFFLLMVMAQLCAMFLPGMGLPVFLFFSVMSGLWLMRAQTKLEIYFINRHLKKHPHSGWNVMAFAKNNRDMRWQRGAARPTPTEEVDPCEYADLGLEAPDGGGLRGLIKRKALCAQSRLRKRVAPLSTALRQRFQRPGKEHAVPAE